MASSHTYRCPICGDNLILETTNLSDKWPREVSGLCPKGHGRHIFVELKDPKLVPPPAPTDPNIPIKYVYEPHARQEQTMELYCAAGAVRRKIGQSDLRVHDYLNQLEQYVNGAIVQIHRILEDHELSINAFWEVRRSPDPQVTMQKRSIPINLTLFLDIHFWVICLDKAGKLYPRVLSHIMRLSKEEKDTPQRRQQKKLVQRRFQLALSQIRAARDFLEHIDERIQAGAFGSFGHRAHGSSHTFTYGGGNYEISVDFKPITDAYEALIGLLRSLPDLD